MKRYQFIYRDKSLGGELYQPLLSQALQADIYFAHPYASWERRMNENINGVIHQFFPKGSDFRNITIEQAQIMVMDRLNNRPKKTRGGKPPHELFMALRADLISV